MVNKGSNLGCPLRVQHTQPLLFVLLSITPQAPSHIKLFVNRPSLGFSEAADEPAQADFVLTDAQLAGETVPLMYADWLGDGIIPGMESFIHLQSLSTFSQPLHDPLSNPQGGKV